MKNVPLSTDDVNIEKNIRRTYNTISDKRLHKNRKQLHSIAVIFIGIHNYSTGMFSIITKKTIYFGEGAIRSPQRGNTSYFLFCFTNTINIISKFPFVSCFTFCFLMPQGAITRFYS